MNQAISGLFLAVMLGAAGCVGGDTRVNEMPLLLSPAAPMDIYLTPYDLNRSDRIYSRNGKPNTWGSMRTGPYWSRVFSDDDALEVVLELTDVKMEMGGIVSQRYVYYISGTFRCGEYSQDVQESYMRHSMSKEMPDAFAVVVNDAVTDLAKKGAAFAIECKSSAQSIVAGNKYSDLERLKKLLDNGALTQEEYDQEKTKVLND